MTNEEYKPTEAEVEQKIKLEETQEYAPTDEEMRRLNNNHGCDCETCAKTLARFVRWLAAHDAEVRADESAKRPDREQMIYRARATEGEVVGPERTSPEKAVEAYWQALALHPFDQEDETPLVESRPQVPWQPLALEPEARETEVVEFNDGPAFRSKGMVHTLTVAPTPGGWLVTCQDFHGESSCNLPSGDAIKLAQMLHPEAREEMKLSGILARAEEVRQDDGWCIGGAWGDYGEVVVPIRILSYVIEGELDQKIASTDPGFALTYAEQERRAEEAEAKLAEAREEPHHALEVDVLTWHCLKCGRPARGHDKAREVTDAEVEAARDAFWAADPLLSTLDSMRVALEAARKVK